MASLFPHTSFLRDASDPLTRQYLAQNLHETPKQRIQREAADAEAVKRSKEIDQWLRAEKSAQQRENQKQRVVRIILVGQSESGKSTTIKNFQLQYAPQSFWAERETWKTVIHLNLVRSVRRIHNALSSLPLSGLSTQDIPPYSPNAYCSILSPRPTETDEDYQLADSRHEQESRPKLSSKHQLLLMRLRPFLDLDAALVQQLMYSNSDHSTNESGLYTASLYVPLPSSRLPTRSRPSWWGKEVPDDLALWPPAEGPSPSSSAIGISALQVPSIVSPRSTASEGSLFTRPGDEPLIYASLWSSRVPSTLQAQLEDPSSNFNRPQGLTSSERQPGHSTVSLQTGSQISVLSKATDTTHASALIPPVSRKASSSSIGSQLSQRSTRSRHLSLAKISLYPSAKNGSERSRSPATPNRRSIGPGNGAASTTDRIMAACAPDIADLWKDSGIRKILDDFFGIQLESEAGFFLDDVERVTALGYEPTDDDILKARLKTLGVSEYRFAMDSQGTKAIGPINEMIIYDVGGSRTQRHQWMNYFEDVDTLIFLAPLSAYDQCLAEDPTVNRVQDTLNLWKSVCSSPLLKKVDFILFLNKCDLLESKLRKGIPFQKYVTSYKGPGTFKDVICFFKSTFDAMWRHANETLDLSTAHGGRTLHIHRTSVIDSRATKKVIADVREAVVRSYMRGIAVL